VIQRFVFQLGSGPEGLVVVERLDGGRVRLVRDGKERILDVRRVAGRGNERASTWSVLADGGGPARLVDVDGTAPELGVTLANVTVPLKLVDARRRAAAVTRPRDDGPAAVRSPMPGKVVKILVKSGDEVKAGQGVVVVEAMKMENELKAPRDGRADGIAVSEGQAVDAGALIMHIHPTAAAS
jgi:biotin carboxyl carrier protein